MLTREGFVAANMSGQSTLQRSSWKAEAIRKGNLKISGPIPIMEDTPLNDEEEKEYAETGALQSPSQPPDELEPLESRPQTPPQPEHPPPSIPMERASLMSHPVDEQTQEVIHERQASRSPPRQQYVTETARESVVEPISYSQNGHRSTPESASKAAQKKKRKSGLRNVFRKMFGRRSRDEPEQEEVSHRGHSYHHSDPGMLQHSSPREAQQTLHGTRISDLPVKELQPLHPLGQHLPFPMNVNAPQASPPKEYLTFDHERPDIGRRRATLPSVPSAGIQRHSLDEPRGRLSAWDEKPDDETLPSPGIGIALSSPTQTTSVQAKRRSRSADALRDMAKESASIDRRRSAEIRYWRQSYASGSVYSRPQTAKTVESIRSVQEHAPAITEPDDGIQAMSATLGHVDEPTPSPSKYDEKQDADPPVSAFNFGLHNDTGKDETRSAQDFVPSSPPERATNRLSIEDRVANLEGTFQSIESSLQRMSSRTNRQTIILSEAPRNLRSRNTSSSNSNSNANFDKLPDYQSSNDTLKSNPASPTLVKPSAEGSKEQVIEKLYEALKYERAARKALEQQVQGLQHDIADLHALVNKLIASATATSPSYPTPSPDTLILSTEERIATPRVERKEQYSHGKENLFRTGSNDDRYARNEAEWREEVPTPNDGDVWATPKEEGFSGSGFFHEERRYA